MSSFYLSKITQVWIEKPKSKMSKRKKPHKHTARASFEKQRPWLEWQMSIPPVSDPGSLVVEPEDAGASLGPLS